MYRVVELYIDRYRKAVITKTSENSIIAVVDILPYTIEKYRYSEFIPFGTLDIARRRLEHNNNCSKDGYKYAIVEEAVCIKTQDSCTVFSYNVYITCENIECNYDDVIDVVKCISSTYQTK